MASSADPLVTSSDERLLFQKDRYYPTLEAQLPIY